jgi:Uncharacterized protein conserved in bacteria (DUF2252)
MNIHKSTQDYEQWIGKYLKLIPADLKLKHQAMASGIFPFFRATFYRWMQQWPEVCPDANKAPKVLAVGDLHVENFGTWRDVEGRLVWGINDFDEAATLPYTLDLVRLAASAHLAIDGAHLAIAHQDACASILNGYREGLSAGGNPFVLAESHIWLREMVHGTLRDPCHFWSKMDALKTIRTEVPGSARKGLERLMPEKGLSYRVTHRIAGLGSLGRERFVALTEYGGGKIAREAKALGPSACIWACGGKSDAILYQEILDSSIRCVDPFVKLKQDWIVRRLAPDCSRVELDQLPKVRDESKLLFAMGFETANVHLGSARAGKAVASDFAKRPKKWLHEAAAAMGKAMKSDWIEWKG